MEENSNYLESLTLLSKAERLSEQYAKKQKEKKDAERKRKQITMMKLIQKDYENLDDTDLVYCLRRMAEF